MQDQVALLRGVNVGGVKVIMADLRALAEAAGFQGAETHLASGNLILAAPDRPEVTRTALEAALAAHLGRRIDVLVLAADACRAMAAACPFPEGQGNQVHAIFPFGPVSLDVSVLAAVRKPSEALVEAGGLWWLHAPEGFGTSQLATNLPRVLTGAPVTVRNLNTVRALVERLDGRGAG